MDADRDAELLQLCREGDEEAWALLVGRYENLVYSAVLQTGIDRETAVDVFQQVWVELHRSLHRIRNPRALPRWFVVTARRLAYRQAAVSNRWVGAVAEDLLDPAPAADESLVALEQRQRLEAAMERLEERCRELLSALFLRRRRPAYKALARRFGIAVGALGPLRARCLRRLRRLMEETG